MVEFFSFYCDRVLHAYPHTSSHRAAGRVRIPHLHRHRTRPPIPSSGDRRSRTKATSNRAMTHQRDRVAAGDHGQPAATRSRSCSPTDGVAAHERSSSFVFIPPDRRRRGHFPCGKRRRTQGTIPCQRVCRKLHSNELTTLPPSTDPLAGAQPCGRFPARRRDNRYIRYFPTLPDLLIADLGLDQNSAT